MALKLLGEILSKFNELRALKLSNLAFLSEQKSRLGFFFNLVSYSFKALTHYKNGGFYGHEFFRSNL